MGDRTDVEKYAADVGEALEYAESIKEILQQEFNASILHKRIGQTVVVDSYGMDKVLKKLRQSRALLMLGLKE